MSPKSSRVALAATAIVIACAGGAIGAALYGVIGPGGTTTVEGATTTVSNTQPVVATNGLSINAIYKNTYKGEVDIKLTTSTTNGFFGTQTGSAEGSGIVYDLDGDIVTNQHVIDGATSITVTFWNGQSFKAKVVGSDESTDLAVIRVNAPKSILHPLPLADSSQLQIGDGVVAIGSPFGLAGSVTSGIISALHRSISSPNNFTIDNVIQTDAPINHGNSGGPLLNALGQVIGVNAQIESNSGSSDGVAFAIPSNTLHSVAAQLIEGITVKHAYLGVVLPFDTQSLPVLRGVETGTPADKAGLKKGDLITELGGTRITSSGDVPAVIDAHKPGDKLSVTYVRDGKTHSATVTLTIHPA